MQYQVSLFVRICMYMCMYLHTNAHISNETVKLLIEGDDVGETCDAFNKTAAVVGFPFSYS